MTERQILTRHLEALEDARDEAWASCVNSVCLTSQVHQRWQALDYTCRRFRAELDAMPVASTTSADRKAVA